MKCFTGSLVAAVGAASIVSVFLVGPANADGGVDLSRAIQPGKIALTQAVPSHQHGAVARGGLSFGALRFGAGEGSGTTGAAYSSQSPAWFKEAAICTWGTLKGCNKLLAYVDRPGGKYWVPVTSVGAAPFNATINRQLGRNRAADESAELGPLYTVQLRAGSGTSPAVEPGSSIGKLVSASTGPSAAATSTNGTGALPRREPLQGTHNGGLEGFFGIDIPADAAFSEPPAYAMLLAGMGVVGFIFLRRVNHR